MENLSSPKNIKFRKAAVTAQQLNNTTIEQYNNVTIEQYNNSTK
jgi:hypothetical protein